eukprot:2742157-Pleurochrysis_carterae.AAC.1
MRATPRPPAPPAPLSSPPPPPGQPLGPPQPSFATAAEAQSDEVLLDDKDEFAACCDEAGEEVDDFLPFAGAECSTGDLKSAANVWLSAL